VAEELAGPEDFTFELGIGELSVTLRALEGYVESWHKHYLEDEASSHTPDEWEEVRVLAGRLIWRLEEAMVLSGQAIAHSRYAVQPPSDVGGGGGVREPRRPRPLAPSAHHKVAADEPAPSPT
jgi:hypothetical protein